MTEGGCGAVDGVLGVSSGSLRTLSADLGAVADTVKA